MTGKLKSASFYPPKNIPKSQRGYILVLNIAVLALLLLGATYMGQQMTTALNMAHAEQEVVEQEARIANARARVFYMLSSLPRSRMGIGAGEQIIIPDGRLYRVDEHVAVRIQDVRGLLSINGTGESVTGRQMLERFLGTYGLDSDTTAHLIDTLLDYRDKDNLRRLNGAEEEEYRAAGKAHWLRNDNLKLPQELSRVYGWADVAALWQEDPVTDHITTNPRPAINPNTADWRVLVAISGTTPEIAKNLLESRRKGEIADITPLVAPGLSMDPFTNGPLIIKNISNELLVTFLPKGSNFGIRFNVVHTPISNTAPWRVQYAERVQTGKSLEQWDTIPVLPETNLLQEDTLNRNQVQLPF